MNHSTASYMETARSGSDSSRSMEEGTIQLGVSVRSKTHRTNKGFHSACSFSAGGFGRLLMHTFC